ncbi:MAG TPA: NrfD/PsrC family molybdoenzyme membrane anchor subunit [Nitrospirota bacterium]|nr:NrfD/PsrC family molybdoenzyme membrane anchor subunit [Nitrospirota bacterium]
MMALESQVPHWEWYYIAMYFFIGGVSAGAYFIGSLAELMGFEKHRQVSRIAYYLAFPLICITPILLIADLGRPERFWHLFFSPGPGMPYMNILSPLSVGTWALLIYSGMTFLSFLNVLVADGRLTSPLLKKLHELFGRLPHKVYAAIGSFFGFFVAGYTGVLLNITALPLWAGTDPLIGSLFIVSGASTGAAAIVLVMAWQRMTAGNDIERLEVLDRIAMIAEIAVLVLMVIVAGQYALPLLRGWYGVLFLGGAVFLGILVPLGLQWTGSRQAVGAFDRTILSSSLVLFGGAILRIALVQAGQL